MTDKLYTQAELDTAVEDGRSEAIEQAARLVATFDKAVAWDVLMLKPKKHRKQASDG